ncbi:MAG: acetyl-CoA carboxylase carboxyl transferase subunit alpha [Candidatus Marinimicrobia bacterium]|nr:acetyl-CoA carboxylase carboxyl transferase subunit alpha [Candidatus Neomarinimicrobiota bacterium]|tara:strand:+ start:20838 stop:21794 length:957 start_codon:yes stop_codon:yes gene_type:complete
MSEFILDFEKPIFDLQKKIDELVEINSRDDIDHSIEITRLSEKKDKLESKIYNNLTRWQRVQLARYPKRPYALDYINRISPDFLELQGDRYFSDDHAIVAGIGSVDNYQVVFVGQQKGKNTKENLDRNFGMARPEGYRKAIRVMKLAEKFNHPVICLIDTPGAYPGIGAEERGQAEAIAKNLIEMSVLTVPILVIVIGEGASGGALGIGIGDRFFMMENTWFSVISPEGCASILWRDASKAEIAADAMKVTAQDLFEMGICDEIISEPMGGAHKDYNLMAERLKALILKSLDELSKLDSEELIERRIAKYDRIGIWEE